MSLTRPRRLTPASLAARRANALKSTGPRTARGKARVGFNALKLGLNADRSARLRDRLIRAGFAREEALYGQIRSRIAQTFGVSTPEERAWCDRLATQVWCLTLRPQARRLFAETKLKDHRKQASWTLRTSTDQQMAGGADSGPSDSRKAKSGDAPAGSTAGRERLNFGIRDPWKRIGLRFWVQHKRYWTPARIRRMLEAMAAAEGETESAGGALAADPKRHGTPIGSEEARPGRPWPGRAGAAEPAPVPGDALDPIIAALDGLEWLARQKGLEHRGPNEGLERAVRSRAFRIAKPGAIERYRYSLTPSGDPDWEQEPWKSALARLRAGKTKKGSQRK